MSKTTNKYFPEVRERPVRMVLDRSIAPLCEQWLSEGQHGFRWVARIAISAKIGAAAQTPNEWVKRADLDLAPIETGASSPRLSQP